MEPNNFHRATILLAEYNSLRSELLTRYTQHFQTIAAIAVVLIGLLTAGGTLKLNLCTIVTLIVLAILIFVGLFIWIDIEIARASTRLREIEGAVNGLAEQTLLRWETEYGIGGVIGKHILKAWRRRHERL
jgi:hypothetical protein